MAVVDTTIPETMRAVLCQGVKDYICETVPVRKTSTLKPGELLVKVTRCGLCAGDAKCYYGASMFWGTKDDPPFVQTPVIPGHEFVGTVVGAGENAEQKHGVSIGDQVTCEQVLACNECLYCRKGMRWLCLPHDIFGFHRNVNGGVCEYMVFPANAIVYKIPSRVPASHAVYVEPLSCAVHGVERGDIQSGDCVVVSGCGPIGLGMIAATKMRSPGRLIALDCNDGRLDIARECGADIVMNPQKENVVDSIRKMTDGYGCDVYLEATGNPASVVQGIKACRKAATFVEFSVFKEPVVLDWTAIGDTKELNIKGGHCSGATGYRVAVDMIASGKLPIDRIVTHALPIHETVQGLEMVNAGAQSSTSSVKVTIDPTISN